MTLLARLQFTLLGALLAGGCATTSTSPTAAAPATAAPALVIASANTQYAAAFKALTWGSAAAVSFPANCTMSLTTSGVPPYHADYYLAPLGATGTQVAVTPVSKTPMALTAYSSANAAQSITIPICPQKAALSTATGGGAIGYMISGEALFNPYEGFAGSPPAMSDNVAYTFTPAGGTTTTAAFIDACNSHPTPAGTGSTWHYHGLPTCLAAQVDGAAGPSHIIGIALDGFPIYGGRDINGNIISTAALDACNGITSPTPEFPSGAYHYVLPIGVTGNASSLNCFSGSAVTQGPH